MRERDTGKKRPAVVKGNPRNGRATGIKDGGLSDSLDESAEIEACREKSTFYC